MQTNSISEQEKGEKNHLLTKGKKNKIIHSFLKKIIEHQKAKIHNGNKPRPQISNKRNHETIQTKVGDKRKELGNFSYLLLYTAFSP